MRFGSFGSSVAVACALMASQAGAVTVVHSGDNEWAYTYFDEIDGVHRLYYEALTNLSAPGLNTVRLDIQGGTLASWGTTLSWSDGGDNCLDGSCSAFPTGGPTFLKDLTYGDTFVQFSYDAPKNHWFQEFFAASMVGPGPTSFTVTYSTAANAVPEPTSWAMMIAGFGLVGSSLRRRKQLAPAL